MGSKVGEYIKKIVLESVALVLYCMCIVIPVASKINYVVFVYILSYRARHCDLSF